VTREPDVQRDPYLAVGSGELSPFYDNPWSFRIFRNFMVEDGRTGPSMAALWQLQHMAFTPDARSVTPGWLRTNMEAAGFVDIQEEDMIPGLTRLVHARKPD